MGQLHLNIKRCKITIRRVEILKFQTAGQVCMLQFSQTSYLLDGPVKINKRKSGPYMSPYS